MPEALPAPGARIETSTWPPVDVREVDGWRVGRSGGFTRRANSAVPSAAACGADPGDRAALASAGRTLDQVEALYAERGARTVVRLDPRAAPGLDGLLAERGYRAAAPTVVMAAVLDGTGVGGTVLDGVGAGGTALDRLRLTWAERPDDAWLEAWLGVKATTTTDVALARRIVEGAPARYLTAHDAAGCVGVLRAAPSHGWLALSCLAVAPRVRRRGVARALTRAALVDVPAGADRAFLQVEESNQAAVALYRQMGFVPVDAYHYRER